MRTRFAVFAVGLAALALSAPAGAAAAPTSENGLTLAASPNQILAGQSMVIYGHLQGPDNAGQRIILYHKIAGRTHFTIIQRTRTDGSGDFEFLRPDGIVITNRKWFVVGPNGTHSSTISEQVSALVSLSSNAPSILTRQRIVLSGHIYPAWVHENQPVLIQEQDGLTGDGWRTIAQTFSNRHGYFSIGKGWRTPAGYTLRAVLAEDPFNVESVSDSLTQTVQQAENPQFTINTSSAIVPEGQPVTISGTLSGTGSTTPQVTLMARLPGSGGQFQAIATANTSDTGAYTFTETPAFDSVYFVRSTLTPKQLRSALLFVGVQDQVSIGSSSPTAALGGSVTVSGNISPNKTGSLVVLQELGTDGYWHNLQYGTVKPGSEFSFSVPFGQPGSTQLRARIIGDPNNIGNSSAPLTIKVSGVAPVTSLPPAS